MTTPPRSPGIRLWIPGVVCLLGGLVGRITLGWNGIEYGRLHFFHIALWQFVWYGAGLILIGMHLTQPSSGACGPASSGLGWLLWCAAALASGLAVLSSCPP